ncbi:hypothetical protein V5O48_015240 [Marasmius crinis-equi]|uniref:UspA domain-containing protein n=1 Tax=Marasmius crinis-equi TaxID=585013 RepID=A0ABR3EV31_9AGAR
MSTSPTTSPPTHPLRSAMKHSSSTVTSPVSSPFGRSQTLPGTPDIEPIPLSTVSTVSSTTGPLLMSTPSELSSEATSPSMDREKMRSYFSPLPQTQVPGYQPKVSFDTFENPAASMFSFTLSSQSDGYKRTRSTRVFLCATSPDESGTEALDWALECFVQDGDEFVVFRGIEENELEKDHDSIREDARELMKYVQGKNQEVDPDRKVSIILEYIAGKVTDTLDRLIALYRPDSVIVGTRGRKLWQMGLKGTMGSVSRYCLTHSPVPIIVVRPERKTKKAIEKRRANPKRGLHFD